MRGVYLSWTISLMKPLFFSHNAFTAVKNPASGFQFPRKKRSILTHPLHVKSWHQIRKQDLSQANFTQLSQAAADNSLKLTQSIER